MTHLDDRRLLLGLAGRAGAGKDTVADVLCQGHQFYRFAFADPVRAEIISAFGVDMSVFDVSTKEHKIDALAIARCTDPDFRRVAGKLGISMTDARSPREIMRWWGTEYRRFQNPHYWTNRAGETLYDAIRRGFRRIVITDLRFRNEAAFVRYHGGKVWEIQRATAEVLPATHVSEQEITALEPDRVIENNKTMTALATAVMKAYRESE